MSQAFTTVGGARIGSMGTLAWLIATPDDLTISVLVLGTYSFKPEQVMAVERCDSLLGWGVQVRHCRTDCPERIIFRTFGSSEALLRRIREAGFVPAAGGAALSSEVDRRHSNPVRWAAMLVALFVWNGLFLLDFSKSAGRHPRLGPFALIAVLLAFLASYGTIRSPMLQQWVLQPGRDVGEIRPFLRLLIVVSGMASLVLSIMWACDGFK